MKVHLKTQNLQQNALQSNVGLLFSNDLALTKTTDTNLQTQGLFSVILLCDPGVTQKIQRNKSITQLLEFTREFRKAALKTSFNQLICIY